MKFITIISLLILLSIPVFSQEDTTIPKDYFRSPMDIPLALSGNFGELRSNHFHAGIDIKTQGVEGKNIYATAEGYVCRIKIQHYGYGKVIYVRHPNGYTTTYAHLKNFSDKIENYVKKKQYEKESYEIELFPSPNELKVEKGEIIALSGNTGGSGGPHLHYEIRETASEHPLNPLLFGLPIEDNIKPIIQGIRIYPLDSNSYLGSKQNAQYFTVTGGNGEYQLRFNDTIRVHGKIGLGIQTIDKLNGASNSCGIYQLDMYKNGDLVYSHDMKCLPFHESRYINSHTEYAYKWDNGKWIQKCYKDPNNQLSIYNDLSNNGVMEFYENSQDTITFVVKDVYGNTSNLEFILTGKKQSIQFENNKSKYVVGKIKYNQPYNLDDEALMLNFPSNILYDDLDLEVEKLPTRKNAFSPSFRIHHQEVPVHKHFEVMIKPDSLPENHKHQMIMASLSKEGYPVSEGGTWEGEYLKSRTRTFGTYFITIDSIPPLIKPINIYDGKIIRSQSSIRFSIQDNFSGIESYKCLVDGKWVLFEYDYKKNLLFHNLDGTIKTGEHNLVLTVIDNRGNKSNYTIKFTL